MSVVNLSLRGETFKFYENIPGNVIRTLKSGKFYEQRMLEYIESLQPKGLLVDVGANIGNHSIYLAHFTKVKRVEAFEAHPKIFKTLERNIKANNLSSRIVAHNVAIGDRKGNVDILDGPKGYLGGSSVIEGDKIPMVKLDDQLRNESVSIIKIDVEGFEPQVLKGAERIIAEQSPILFIEARTKPEKKVIDGILNNCGYKAIRVFNRTATYCYEPVERLELSTALLVWLKGFRIFRLFN